MRILCKVKTKEQIESTLDERGCCSRVFMAPVMYRHCGEVYIARPLWGVEGKWRLYDKKYRPICSDIGDSWTWVSEWLDFGEGDKNDLTKILVEGFEK